MASMVDPITMGGSDPQTELLRVLTQIAQTQQQPLLPPGNTMAGPAAILSGFSSGMRGQQNPVLDMFRQQREQQLEGLKAQAHVAGTMATVETHRQQRLDAARKFALDAAEKMENSDSYEERLHALKLKQNVVNPLTGQPLIPREAPIERMAFMKGKEYVRKRDHVLTMLQQGENPFDTSRYGSQFPKEMFPEADSWLMAMQQGGPGALEGFKEKPHQPTEGALKARWTFLKTLKDRNEEQERELGALGESLKLSDTGQNTVLTLAKTLKQEDQRRGTPLKDDSAYIELAFKKTDRSESFERDLNSQADLRFGEQESTAKLLWKQQQREDYQRKIAEVKAGAVPLSVEATNKLTVLRDAKATTTRLLTEFKPEERARYSGWLNYTGRLLAQALTNDPKFAQFRALIARAQTDLAFAEAGKALTGGEKEVVFGWVPTGKEISPADFEAKLREAYNRTESVMEDFVTLATSPKDALKRAPVVAPPPTAPMIPGGIQFRYRKLPDGRVLVEPMMPPVRVTP